ncbi:hypothetical protein CRYUN_Cryun16bG0076900 [Craigia yunnanensis]
MEQNPDEQNNMQSSAAANGTSSDQDAETDNEEYTNSFPPGYRFAPTDDELMEEYLMKKINNEPLPPNQIHEVNLYSKDPNQLTVEYKPITETEWYFFTPRVKKYPNGSRPKRGTPNGYWKPTGVDKAIPHYSQNPVGFKKTLDFFIGEYPKGNKNGWKMHEYKVTNNNKNSQNKGRAKDDMTLDKWVLCRIYKNKRKNGGDEASTSGTQPPTDSVAQNNEESLMVENNNIGLEDQNSIASQPTFNTWNASQPTFNVPLNYNNIGFEDQTWNASQPTFNVPQNNEASLMAGNNNIGFENQTWNASQPTFNAAQNNEASLMAGNNNIGCDDQTWNASQLTFNVPQNNEVSLMAGNNNIRFEDQTWNTSQPTFKVPQNNEASLMAGNQNIGFEDQAWDASQPTVNVLQNNEASLLMARNNNMGFGYQNSNASQSTPHQRPMYAEQRTSQSCFTISPDGSDFWDDQIDLPAFDGQSSANGI